MAAAAAVAVEVPAVAEQLLVEGPLTIVELPKVVAAQSPSGCVAFAAAVVGSLARGLSDARALPWAW